MQSHPSCSPLPLQRVRLAELVSKYPKSAGALFQTFNDITLAQKWTDVDVLDLPKCGRGAIKGVRPSLAADEPPSLVVVPCALAETLSTSWIRDVFSELDNEHHYTLDTIFVAICSEDSSIVYYKIGKGIMKPQV